jgi:hypothetical protein
MYNEQAERQDGKMAENWKGEVDDVLYAVRQPFFFF